MLGLNYLISPMDTTVFLDEYYGKKSILVTGNEDKFEGLFGWDDVNYLAAYSPAGPKGQRLVDDKQSLPFGEFRNFAHWIHEGATFVINHLQTKHPGLDVFTRVLSGELNTTVNVNSYISYESKQGFDTHYDRHDVFIIQTEGTKEWKVFKPTLLHPLEYMNGPKGEPPESEPYLECEMTPGDVLYIPRGHWHYALAKNSSIHLTVGPAARSPIDFMRWWVEQELWSNAAMRRDFPVAESELFHGSMPTSELDSNIEEFQKYLVEQLTGDSFMTLFKEWIMSSNTLRHFPRASFPHQQMLKDRITLDTVFQLPTGQKILLQYDDSQRVGVILSRGIAVDVEGIGKQELAELFTHDPDHITARQVLESFPNSDEKKIKRLLIELTERGVLEFKPETAAPSVNQVN